LVSRVILDTLAPEGWDVVVREDGVSAIMELESSEVYELIITDYELPGVNGLALARAAPASEAKHHVHGQPRRAGGVLR
jgi:CheY-like chemotaxis protein